MYYKVMRRERHPQIKTHHRSHRHGHSNSMHRIYLLPTPTSPSFPQNIKSASPQPVAADANIQRNGVMVYAPVPVGGLSEQDALQLHATEAWIPSTPGGRHHRHSRSHSGSSHSSRSHHHSHHGSHRNHSHAANEAKLVDVEV